MAFELASNFVGQQVDYRVEVLGLFLRGHREVPGFDSNFPMLAIFVNRQDQMNLACALEEFCEVREFSLRIRAQCFGRFDVPESYCDVGDRKTSFA